MGTVPAAEKEAREREARRLEALLDAAVRNEPGAQGRLEDYVMPMGEAAVR